MVKSPLADISSCLPALGFIQANVAVGEISGTIVSALGPEALAIGPEIDPGIPWTRMLAGTDAALALGSGNFGAPDFFLKAWSMLR